LVFAEDEVASAARWAVVAMASVPAQADTLARLEERHVGSDGVNDAGNLMARRAGELDAGPLAFFRKRVAVANAAGHHADADMTGAGLGKFFCYELERTAGGGYLHGTAFDWWHGEVFSCALDVFAPTGAQSFLSLRPKVEPGADQDQTN
jgi:hypothetical protein